MPEVVPVIVAAIENQDGKVLLLKRAVHKKWAPGAWNLVTGHIEHNEEPLSAAIREIQEETGLDVELAHAYSIYDVDFEGKTWRTWAFRFTTTQLKPRLNEEHSEFVWVEPANIQTFEIVSILEEDLRQMKYIGK